MCHFASVFHRLPTAGTSIRHFNYTVPPVWVLRGIWKLESSSTNLQLHFIAKLKPAFISWLCLICDSETFRDKSQQQTSTAIPLVQTGNSKNMQEHVFWCSVRQKDNTHSLVFITLFPDRIWGLFARQFKCSTSILTFSSKSWNLASQMTHGVTSLIGIQIWNYSLKWIWCLVKQHFFKLFQCNDLELSNSTTISKRMSPFQNMSYFGDHTPGPRIPDAVHCLRRAESCVRWLRLQRSRMA